MKIIHRFFLSLVFFFVVGLSLVFASSQLEMNQGEALAVTQPMATFLANEAMIRLSPQAVSHIDNSTANQSGIQSLDVILERNQVVKFAPAVVPGPKSLAGHDLFRWYYIQTTAEASELTEKDIDLNSYASLSDSIPAQKLVTLLTDLSQLTEVEIVEPHFQTKPLLVPNDLLYHTSGSWGQAFEDLWWLHQIQPEQAWEQVAALPAGNDIVVATIDTGIDYNHPDISDHLYQNPGEVVGNGIDDDGNGYIDDVSGWDFGNSDNDLFDDSPFAGHGTMVAGIIAGEINNDVLQDPLLGKSMVGVAGFSHVKILPVKVYHSTNGGPYQSGCYDLYGCAIVYAADLGAAISNSSISLSGALHDDAIKYQHDLGMIAVVAGGNTDRDISIDKRPAYGVIVSRSGLEDSVLSGSNWGEQVDVTAPGTSILSLKNSLISGGIFGQYAVGSGTSFSAPQVSGLAAIIKTLQPNLTNEEFRQLLHLSSDDSGEPGKDYRFGYGRINVSAAATLAGQFSQGAIVPLSPMIRSPKSYESLVPGIVQFIGDVRYQQSGTPADFVGYQLSLGHGPLPNQWEVIGSGATAVTNGVLGQYDSHLLPEGISTLRFTASTSNLDFEYTKYILADNLWGTIYCYNDVAVGETISCSGISMSRDRVQNIFDHYILDYQIANSGNTWYTEGVTMANGGLSELLTQQTLGTINTSSFEYDQEYRIRLRTISIFGNEDIRMDTVRTLPPPLAVEIEDFSSRVGKSGVILEWTTVSELNLAGFNVYRRPYVENDNEKVLPDWVKINKSFIPAQLGSITGNSYSLVDSSVTPGVYEYALETVDLSGHSHREWFTHISFSLPVLKNSVK